MNKKFSKFLAAGLTTVICLASAVVPVFAAGSNYSETIGTKTGIEKYTTFDKYLVMDEGANVPNVEFAYAITAGAHINYSVENQVFEVLSGVDVDKVTITWDQANATTASSIISHILFFHS